MASKVATALGGAVLMFAGAVYAVQSADLLEGLGSILAMLCGAMLIMKVAYELLD
jgi:hypothetical protein